MADRNAYSEGYVSHEVVKVLQNVNRLLTGRSVVRMITSVSGGKEFAVLVKEDR